MNAQILPIAETNGGDCICIGVANKYEGKVWYWSSGQGTDDLLVRGNNVFLVADSFTDFLTRFEFHEVKFDLDDIEIELDPSLVD